MWIADLDDIIGKRKGIKMINILIKPYTNEEYAKFANEANSENKRIELNGEKAYALSKWEILGSEGIIDISKTPEYIEEEAQKEAERVARLKMTKLDFFKYVVAPTGTTYAQLIEAVGSNDLLKATWDLCNHVYRGDEVLNDYVTELLKVSPEQLNEVFKEYGD